MTSQLVAAAAIVDSLTRPTRLLAARRSSPPRLAGMWELPGGKVEDGEGAEAAVHRELAEELGVRVELGRRIEGPMAGDWPILDGLVMRVWLARIRSGSPEPLADHDELRWVPTSGWDEVAWLEPDVPLLQAIWPLTRS
ncbi:MAG TPA: NUDIX domain-containing protein [Actinomycetaceae bacterium]|nr:NUDIX domain-containing protein [Actinomycetaceae bacterium]